MRGEVVKVGLAAILGAGTLSLIGCSGNGSGTTDAAQAQNEAAPMQTAQLETRLPPFFPPAVSIGQNDAASATTNAVSEESYSVQEPINGTPEWLVRQITRITTAPVDRIRQPIAGRPGEFEEIRLSDAEIATEEVRRAQEVVGYALEVCRTTRGDDEKEQLFNLGVHHLAVARCTLALSGDREQPRLLGEESETLFKIAPASFAAIESHLQLVELLQKLADREGRGQPEWARAAARQARLFASRFPAESTRAAMTLLTASRACESAGLFSEARECLLSLERDYSQTPFAEHSAGALRRYRLAGTPLAEFAGATIDGAFLSVDQFRGHPVLIVFWSIESRDFREDLPRLREAVAAFGDRPLTVLGVNLDRDEAAVDSYLEEADLPWRTFFFTNPEQRGLRNPLARAYGVTSSPQYWVVDAEGVVRVAPTDISGAERALAELR